MMCDTAILTYFLASLFDCKNKIKIVLFYFCYFALTSFKIDFDYTNASDASIVLANIMPLLVTVTLIYLFFRASLLESVVTTIFNIMAVVIIQAFSYIIMNKIADFIVIDDDLLAQIVQLLYMITFLFLTMRFKQSIKNLLSKILEQINKMTGKSAKQLKILSLTIILIIASIFTMISYRDDRQHLFDVTTVLYVLVVILILVSYYKSTIEKVRDQGRQETERISDIHKDFVNSINNFGHSYNNLIQTISFLVNCEELTLEDVRPVLNDIVEWSEENKINNKLRYINIPNVVIASVLSIKYSYAESLHVKLDVKYNGNKSISINSKDFIDVLNIVMDNAIEAAHYTDDKIVLIDVDFDHVEYINIKIVNHFAVDENNQVLKYGDSKKIGLGTIDDIVDKTKNLEVNYSVKDHTYEVDINIWEPV